MATTRGEELTAIDLHTGGATRYQVYMDKARNMTASRKTGTVVSRVFHTYALTGLPVTSRKDWITTNKRLVRWRDI